MKKTLKKLFAVMLAAVMAFGSLTAFAADDTNQLEWDFYGEYYYYNYAGTLTEGENKIEGDDFYYNVWYTFNAPASGFYCFSYNEYDADMWIGIPERFEGDKAYDEKPLIYFNENDIENYVFHLDAGETVIGFDVNYIEDDTVLNIEYYGEEITAVEAPGSHILNYDIYTYDYEGKNTFELYADEINISFSSGKTVTKSYAEGTVVGALKSGVNTLKTDICGKIYEMEVDVYLVNEIVESVEISNINNYLAVDEYYDGYNGLSPYGETLTVTFVGGEKSEVKLNEDDYLTLPNGREVWCYTAFDIVNDKPVLDVYVADTKVASYNCTIEPSDAMTNLEIMGQNNASHLSNVSYYFRNALIQILESNSFDEFINIRAERAGNYIVWAIESFLNIFTEAYALVSYLMS